MKILFGEFLKKKQDEAFYISPLVLDLEQLETAKDVNFADTDIKTSDTVLSPVTVLCCQYLNIEFVLNLLLLFKS